MIDEIIAIYAIIDDLLKAIRHPGQTHLVNKTASISTSPGSIAVMVAY
jgi:hypothetical protein